MTTYSRSFLYEKYKNDCVSREEFSKLADLAILLRLLKKIHGQLQN